MNSRRVLEEQAVAWGLSLDAAKLEGLLGYAELLESYELANVIGTRDYNQIVVEHILDSLSCFLAGRIEEGMSLVDVGAGGGLPGVPIKIAAPNLEVALIESTGKKARFLEWVATNLKLEHVTVLNGRAEEYGASAEYRSQYDVATARALASLSVIAEYCVPLLKTGGRLVAMKARLQDDELQAGGRAASLLGARVVDVVVVPHTAEVGERERRLVVFEKVLETPAKYPRPVGSAKTRPLGVRNT